MTAREGLLNHLTGRSLCPPPRPVEEATGLLDAYRAEVRTEMVPDDQETLEEAATAYRHLRPMIEATMADPSRWDGDADEATILGEYVRWLAAEREHIRAEVLREAGDRAEDTAIHLRRNYATEESNGAMNAAADIRALATTPGSDTGMAEFTRRVNAVVAEALGHTTSPDPIAVHWNRLVIHPDTDPTDDTIVCCLTDDGHPVALLLDDEHREALGLVLVDPNGDDDEPDTPTPPDLADRLYDALTTYAMATPNHLMQDVAWRLSLADHLERELARVSVGPTGYAETRGEPGGEAPR
jgi:hypothetical protein